MTKSTKSHQRERSPLFENSSRVHELVARAMRGEFVRHGINRKSAVLPLSTVSAIPRVRTYHTKKPSRFVHALSARPLKVHGGRGWSKYADGMESTFFILAILGFYLVGVGAIDDPHGRGINTYAKHVCRRRRDRVRLAAAAKNHKETFLIVFFSLVRKERKGQKEECFPLLNSFCRLAATRANTLPRPSGNC